MSLRFRKLVGTKESQTGTRRHFSRSTKNLNRLDLWNPMLNRYGFLPYIRNLTRPRILMSKIQSHNVQAKRSVEDSSVTPPPFKKQFVRQTKAADIHPTTDLDTVEYFFENGSCILYFGLHNNRG